MQNLSETKSWKNLKSHYQEAKDLIINDLFDTDANRFDTFSVRFNDFLLDYSKNRINNETMKLLFELADERNLKSKIDDQFSGKIINTTEKRAVLHSALRNISNQPVYLDNENIMPRISEVQRKMQSFIHSIHSGQWKGASGKSITDIVNLGIGGSDLGPRMVCEALKSYHVDNIKVHFVSNVDGTDITETLNVLNPESTLFIIASKTFTTQETLTNANTAKKWFLSNGANKEDDVAKHFIALSTNEIGVKEFGIDLDNMFEFWDWVGGRYSLWSAIGLSIALQIGWDNFKELLTGANDMDIHFKETDFERNLPVIMALLGVWYQNFFGSTSHAVIPYDQYLSRFPEFLQQLDMESNGKSVTISNEFVDYSTGAVIWGTAGTNSQHSFFQLIHQGTSLIPVDFIGFVQTLNPEGEHHNILMSNFFAQTEALMKGKSIEDAVTELKEKGLSEEQINDLANHKFFEGNKPTNSLLIKKLTPRTLGSLIALYEHKVFVQGVIWGINSFDQWGVELGKQLAKSILPELIEDNPISTHDSSTNGLINHFKKYRD